MKEKINILKKKGRGKNEKNEFKNPKESCEKTGNDLFNTCCKKRSQVEEDNKKGVRFMKWAGIKTVRKNVRKQEKIYVYAAAAGSAGKR